MSGLFVSLLLLTTVVAGKDLVSTITTDDVTVASTKDTTTTGMSSDQFLSTTNCTLTTTNDSFSELKLVMTLSPAIIYMKLNFTKLEFRSATAYLNETPNILDPMTWMWASKGKGYLLRNFFDNYLVVSFGTLSSGVHYTNIQIDTSDCPNFMNVSDSTKLEILANFLTLSSNRACKSINEKRETCKDYQVCQSFLRDRWSDVKVLFYSLHFVLLRCTYTKCWSSVTNNEVGEFRKTDWGSPYTDAVTRVAQLLLVAYFPLIVLRLMTQERAPIHITNSEVWIGPNDSIPVGLKYWLFTWNGGKYGSRFVSSLRYFMTYMLINLVSFLDLIVMYFTDDTYQVKRASVFRYMISFNTHLIFLVLYFFCTLVITVTFLYVIWNKYEQLPNAVKYAIKTHGRLVPSMKGSTDMNLQAHISWDIELRNYMTHCIRVPFDKRHTFDFVNDISPFPAWINFPFFVIYTIYVLIICFPIFVMTFVVAFAFRYFFIQSEYKMVHKSHV
ncbi:uncharacterized protein [Amphiura filiformis]|uniref:uncharacterized protein n=1 Tax=Amphiura filiformis TaxID=82378 RepID=UPI003B215A99